MTEPGLEQHVLTREELAAILQSVEESHDATAGDTPFRPERGMSRATPLFRALEDFGSEQGRALSTLYQRPIRLVLTNCETTSLRAMCDGMLRSDRVAAFDLDPGAGRVHMQLSRTLLYGWLALAFGSRAEGAHEPLPERGYTRIEERFLRRTVIEVAQLVAERLGLPATGLAAGIDLLEPEMVAEEGRKQLLASFDVEGFDDLCRLRIALPEGLVDGVAPEPDAAGATADRKLAQPLLDMRVRVRVEAGLLVLPLRRAAELAVGDILPLEPVDPQGLVVSVEEERKFRAVRGTVGQRLAVQLTDRL